MSYYIVCSSMHLISGLENSKLHSGHDKQGQPRSVILWNHSKLNKVVQFNYISVLCLAKYFITKGRHLQRSLNDSIGAQTVVCVFVWSHVQYKHEGFYDYSSSSGEIIHWSNTDLDISNVWEVQSTLTDTRDHIHRSIRYIEPNKKKKKDKQTKDDSWY